MYIISFSFGLYLTSNFRTTPLLWEANLYPDISLPKYIISSENYKTAKIIKITTIYLPLKKIFPNNKFEIKEILTLVNKFLNLNLSIILDSLDVNITKEQYLELLNIIQTFRTKTFLNRNFKIINYYE